MSQTIQITNFNQLNIVEDSQLSADAAVTATSLSVNFSDNLAANDYLVIGTLGSPGSELVQVQSVTDADTIVITSGLTKAHNRFDKVTKIFGNQIQVYRASNVDGTQPDDGDFGTVGSPFDIDIDQLQTSYTDATGSSDYWYKYVYYNETSTNSTSLADSKAARGGSVGDYASIESIRREAGFSSNTWITDSQIDEKRQAAQQIINSTLAGIYTLPFTTPINPLIAEITRLLSAGYLLTDDYGPATRLNTAEGQKKIDQAMALLEKLNTKELVLTDNSGSDTSIPGSGAGVSFWPNASTATAADEDGGGERAFRVSTRY